VSFEAIGFFGPYPAQVIWSLFTPSLINASYTAFALFLERRIL